MALKADHFLKKAVIQAEALAQAFQEGSQFLPHLIVLEMEFYLRFVEQRPAGSEGAFPRATFGRMAEEDLHQFSRFL